MDNGQTEQNDRDVAFEEVLVWKGQCCTSQQIHSFQSIPEEVLKFLKEADNGIQEKENQTRMLHDGERNHEMEEGNATAEWNKIRKGYKYGILQQNGSEKQGTSMDSFISVYTGDTGEGFSQLKAPKSGNKFPSYNESIKQEDPFVPMQMLQPNIANCLDLSLKLSHPLNTFGEGDYFDQEENGCANYANNTTKWKRPPNLSRLVSRPCSILVSAGSGELTDNGDCKLRRRGCDGTRGEEGGKCHNRRLWRYSPSNASISSYLLSAFPGSVNLGLVQSFGPEADSGVKTTENCLSDQKKTPLAHDTECAKRVPKLTNSDNLDSTNEAEELEIFKEEESSVAATPSISKDRGHGALDLLVSAIQAMSGPLFGEDDNDILKCFREEDDKIRPSDSQLSVKANHLYGKSPVVRKRVLRRARNVFKKPIVEESFFQVANFPSPKRGRKKPALQQPQEQTREGKIKIKLSVSSVQSIMEEAGPAMRSKRGRSQILPIKFYDSVLQSWKRKSRRKQKMKM